MRAWPKLGQLPSNVVRERHFGPTSTAEPQIRQTLADVGHISVDIGQIWPINSTNLGSIFGQVSPLSAKHWPKCSRHRPCWSKAANILARLPNTGRNIGPILPTWVESEPNLSSRRCFSTIVGPVTVAITNFCDHGICFKFRRRAPISSDGPAIFGLPDKDEVAPKCA